MARVVVPGLSHHVTHRGNNRQDLFFTDDDRGHYLHLLAENAERYDLRVEAYCLMTNHIHVVAIPGDPGSLALGIGRTHHQYAIYLNRLHGRVGHLWHERFFSCPMDRGHRPRAIRYVEQNPRRAGMVARAWDYPWSSAKTHCGLARPHRVLTAPGPASTPAEWRQILRSGLHDDDLSVIRERVVSGRPLASDSFISRLEARLNRRLRPRPNGRPRKA